MAKYREIHMTLLEDLSLWDDLSTKGIWHEGCEPIDLIGDLKKMTVKTLRHFLHELENHDDSVKRDQIKKRNNKLKRLNKAQLIEMYLEVL